MLFSFTFGGRIPHPPIVLLFLSIYSCVVSYKKKKKKLDLGASDHTIGTFQLFSSRTPCSNNLRV